MIRSVLSLTVALCCLLAANLQAQPYKPKQLLYGVAYYDVYMPQSRIAEDIKLMKACGINTVRIAESTWSVWEPEDGQFDFSRLDKMLDAFHKAGIHVIVGTPTYAVPQWLVRKYPDIMVTRFDGQVAYGSRQNMDITNPNYLRHAERLIRTMMEHINDHPAIIGYQLDNETKSYHTASKYAKDNFRQRVKEKFKTTDSLNRAWNLYFWSQSISDFDDLHISGVMANQAISLEWSRFQQQLATDFLLWQRSIVDEYKKPGQFVTQNFDYHWRNGSVGPQSEVNHYTASQAIDIAGTDIYHKTQDELDGVMIAFGGDNTRSLKQDNYFVMETNGQVMSWHSDNIFPPYDGQLRLCFYSHLASGANMVAYWPWHTIHNGGETYIKGILGHDLQPNRGFHEVSRTSKEAMAIQDKIISLKKTNKVAILYSIDSFNALKIKHLSTEFDFSDIFMQIYEAFYKQNIEVDIITPHNFELDNYDLLVIPPLMVSPDSMLQQIDQYVNQGGHVLMFYKSGYADENFNMRTVRMPGILRKACGFTYQDYTNTKTPVPLKGNPFQVEEDANQIHCFMELLVPETCEVLATYDHKHWGDYAAITRNNYGKGSLTYVGTLTSNQILAKIVEDVAQKAKVTGAAQKLAFPLIVRNGVNQQGKTIHYILNYSDREQTFTYPFKKGQDLLTKKKLQAEQSTILNAWDLMIIEEN